jgi:hypothetical protein
VLTETPTLSTILYCINIIILLFLFGGEDRRQELEISSIEFKIYQLSNDITYLISVSLSDLINLDIFPVAIPEVLQIFTHFLHRFIDIAFVIFERDKWTHLLSLKAKYYENNKLPFPYLCSN